MFPSQERRLYFSDLKMEPIMWLLNEHNYQVNKMQLDCQNKPAIVNVIV